MLLSDTTTNYDNNNNNDNNDNNNNIKFSKYPQLSKASGKTTDSVVSKSILKRKKIKRKKLLITQSVTQVYLQRKQSFQKKETKKNPFSLICTYHYRKGGGSCVMDCL